MSLHRSHAEALFEARANRPLADFVAELRADGASWRAIEREVFAAADVAVSSLSLSRWYGGDDSKAGAA